MISLPEYSYYYFDSNQQFSVKKLNIFECFLRKAFGMYKETRLSAVVKTIYKNSLNDLLSESTQENRQTMLRLIAKHQQRGWKNKCSKFLKLKWSFFEPTSGEGVVMKFKASYKIDQRDPNHLSISNVCITILVKSLYNDSFCLGWIDLQKSKDKGQTKLMVYSGIPFNWTDKSYYEKYPITSNLAPYYLATKILKDSQNTPVLNKISYEPDRSRINQPQLMEEVKKNLSWSADKIEKITTSICYQGQLGEFTTDKSTYSLSRETALENNSIDNLLGEGQKVSLNFAFGGKDFA